MRGRMRGSIQKLDNIVKFFYGLFNALYLAAEYGFCGHYESTLAMVKETT